jgi:hypothetical protein
MLKVDGENRNYGEVIDGVGERGNPIEENVYFQEAVIQGVISHRSQLAPDVRQYDSKLSA